ncbi:hypothetical protein Alches_07790 [Alicyclobacillus hesperidum subsp. aegles]|uniref:amidohydrolase family protein n=1 Tax=Alicyclobacillus hesperidum TaxID=89784 RepID=UPI00222C7203|nr:amidohydrolase family protein [Alicyclobacillus hesperidum]GLG00740.1 hypothetical protein Alches_07790 [Alicyclobacillus hesperidum subsp. aegles]
MYDVHSHWIPQEVLDWLKTTSAIDAVWEQRVPDKEPFLTVGGKWSFELKRAFYDLDLYLADQSANGIEHTLVSPVPQLFLYDVEPEVTKQLAAIYNEALACVVTSHRTHLSGLATLPLNDPDAACHELERAMARGLKGAIVGPGVGDIPLSDERFAELWSVADRLGAIVFLHPLLNTDKRIQRLMMPNLIGVPWETTISALDLILGGILDRYPNMRVLLAHGGGFLPYQLGRLNKGYEVWPQIKARLNDEPASYMRRFWYDSVLWSAEALQLLCSVAGKERVLPGSDYPFDLKAWPPIEFDDGAVRNLLGLTHA